MQSHQLILFCDRQKKHVFFVHRETMKLQFISFQEYKTSLFFGQRSEEFNRTQVQ